MNRETFSPIEKFMATRYSNPQAEAKYSWLTGILDTFFISDIHLEEHLVKLAKKGVVPACHEGCHNCCLKPTVPVTAPELAVISWYASEVLTGNARSDVKHRLSEHDSRLECPFLIDRVCSIYPVRPLICRQFLIKSKSCEVNENVLETRVQDIIPLPRDTLIRPVAMRLLDYYKFKNTTAKQKAFESGFIVKNARDMHLHDLTSIARIMEHFDNKTDLGNLHP